MQLDLTQDVLLTSLQFVSGSDDFQLRVYNISTGERVTSFEAHPDYIRCMTVHPTLSLVLTGSDDMTIKAWDWDKGWRCVQVGIVSDGGRKLIIANRSLKVTPTTLCLWLSIRKIRKLSRLHVWITRLRSGPSDHPSPTTAWKRTKRESTMSNTITAETGRTSSPREMTVPSRFGTTKTSLAFRRWKDTRPMSHSPSSTRRCPSSSLVPRMVPSRSGIRRRTDSRRH